MRRGRGHYAEYDPSNPMSFFGNSEDGSTTYASDSDSDSSSSGPDIPEEDDEDWQAFQAQKMQLFQSFKASRRKGKGKGKPPMAGPFPGQPFPVHGGKRAT